MVLRKPSSSFGYKNPPTVVFYSAIGGFFVLIILEIVPKGVIKLQSLLGKVIIDLGIQ